MFFLLQKDKRSATARNIEYLNGICQCDILKFSSWKVKEKLPRPSACEPWRTQLLTTFVKVRNSGNYEEVNLSKTQLEEMLRSLCVS